MAKTTTSEIDLTDHEIVAEADELEMVIPILDTLYDAGDPCIHPITKKVVPNPMYDEMRKRLHLIRPTSKVFEGTNASEYQTTRKKVRHDPPMTSITKANGSLSEKDDQRMKWLKRVWTELKYSGDLSNDKDISEYIVQAYKFDGLACSILYKKGKLVSAGLRPRNGIDGEDITENIQYVHGVQSKLPLPIDIIIRGELYCVPSVFEKKNKEIVAKGERSEPFANERNYTAGSIRQYKDPTKTKDRELSFRAYSLLGHNNPPYKTEYERALFCAKELNTPFVRISKHHYVDLKKLEDVAKDQDYRTDGIVLSVNNLEDQQQMGQHGSGPEAEPWGKIAWKFEEEHAACPIKEINWATGRTRKITPVALFDSVTLADTQVKHVTLHNLGYMRRSKIGVGTVIAVIKSGNIIPYVQDVISNLCKDPGYPVLCPTCGHPTQIEDNGGEWTDPTYMANLICSFAGCGSSFVNSMIHFLTIIGVKGVGESALQTLYDKKFVEELADLFELDWGHFKNAGFSSRETILNLCRLRMYDQPEQEKDDAKLRDWYDKNISKKIKMPVWKFFASLGISGAGKSAGRILESEFKTFDAIMALDKTDMEKLDGIGSITASAIVDFFSSNFGAVKDLLKYIEPESPKAGGILTGQTYCLSGSFENGKDYWEKLLSDNGAVCVSSVSKKVTHFVAGPGSGSKSQKASELGLTVLTEDDLKKMGIE